MTPFIDKLAEGSHEQRCWLLGKVKILVKGLFPKEVARLSISRRRAQYVPYHSTFPICALQVGRAILQYVA